MTNNQNTPTMTILAGPNGSGKTSVLLEKISKDIPFLNPDNFSREIAKGGGAETPEEMKPEQLERIDEGVRLYESGII